MKSSRLQSIDLVRGLVMMLMALDHVRDFFSDAHFDPTDLKRTTSFLFVTRWITHYCAPTFVFLAGVSAGIQRQRSGDPLGLARFLLTRGLWLVVLELTFVNWGWSFDPFYHFVGLQVIWVLGLSMILLAGLQFIPKPALGVISLGVILSHNLFDTVSIKAPWWFFLHRFGPLASDGEHTVMVLYPLVPWFAVMSLGFAISGVFAWEPARRRRTLLLAGALAIGVFVILRVWNAYGDPRGFTPQADTVFSLWSFLNCEKYPPSLLYLCMTLGPLCVLLALLDGAAVGDANPFLVFGRVPLFFYLLHIWLIHTTQVIVAAALGIPLARSFVDEQNFGFPLAIVYLVWLGVLLVLYFPSRWYARKKAASQNKWLSYL